MVSSTLFYFSFSIMGIRSFTPRFEVKTIHCLPCPHPQSQSSWIKKKQSGLKTLHLKEESQSWKIYIYKSKASYFRTWDEPRNAEAERCNCRRILYGSLQQKIVIQISFSSILWFLLFVKMSYSHTHYAMQLATNIFQVYWLNCGNSISWNI